MSCWLGIDIGGANLKLATCEGSSAHSPFPLWKFPDRLHLELARMLPRLDSFDEVALTMTGEMADCYATREEGVCRILEQVTRVIPAGSIRVYSVGGQWLSVSQAARSAWEVAASNWLALANYVTRWSENDSTLLIDMGSTTTDIIAMADGRVLSKAKTDRDRLISGELVYTGVERSSITGLVRELKIHGKACPIINEFFATTGDVQLILGHCEESPQDRDTADQRPKTRQWAAYRLARTIGEDGTTLGSQEIQQMAEEVYQAQLNLIVQAIQRVSKQFPERQWQRVILSGHGIQVIEDALTELGWHGQRVNLATCLGSELSRCAPAFAVATLAQEQWHRAPSSTR